MLTEGTKEMDFQLVLCTDVNRAPHSARQVLLVIGAQSSSAKGAKYSTGGWELEAPILPGRQSVPATLPHQNVTPSVSARVQSPPPGWGGLRGVNAELGCHNTGGIQRRGLRLLHRHIWPRLPKRLCVLLQRSTLPATVGLLVWKWGMCVTGGLTTNTINFLH